MSWLIAAALLAAAPAARGMGSSELATSDPEARAAIQAGTRCFHSSQYEEAVRHLQKAYLRAPLPKLLFIIAQAQKKAGHAREALAQFQRFLAVAPPELLRSRVEGGVTLRAKTQGYIAELQASLEEERRAPPQPPRSDSAPPSARAPARPQVMLHLESSSSSVRLYPALDPRGTGICQAPCDVAVEGGVAYFVKGEGIRPSFDFSLPLTAQAVTVHVQPGPWRRLIGGLGLTLGGVGVFITGMVAISVAAPSSHGSDRALGLGLGIPFTLGGAAMIAGGGVMLHRSSTRVRLEATDPR